MMKIENEISIEDLVRKAQDGEREAFSEIVRLLMNKITALTYKITTDRDLAVDVAQDSFISAWQNLHTFNFDAKFESWLYRIAYNKSLNAIKREDRTVNDYAFDIEASTSNPEKDFYRKELQIKVLNFLDTLPTEQRAVFEFKFYKGLTFIEIADTTGKALGTVKTLYREAVKKLRDVAMKQRWTA